MDNLSSHTRGLWSSASAYPSATVVESVHGALYPHARRLVKPNEIAISLFCRQCLGKRRIGDHASLRKQARAWNRRTATGFRSSGTLLANRLDANSATKSHGHGTRMAIRVDLKLDTEACLSANRVLRVCLWRSWRSDFSNPYVTVC